MNFDLTSFFELFIGNINNNEIQPISYIILSFGLIIFFLIKDIALVKKEYLKENTKDVIANFIVKILISLAVGTCCLYMISNLLISAVFGGLVAVYLDNQLFINITKKKKENSTTEKEEKIKEVPSVENNININLNQDEVKLIPDFYDPGKLELPDNINNLNQLNIISILELYGYISPNQKFKMITQSLFETPDEQVEKLLSMQALEKEELREAKAILNLIRLNNRLISKEEALQCIMEIESKSKKGESDNHEENKI